MLVLNPTNLRAEPFESAFSGWLLSRANSGAIRKASSTAVYRHMWEAFAQWCVSRSIDLDALSEQDLNEYLVVRGNAAELSPRYAWRLLHLIDAVLAHCAREQGLPASMAAQAVLDARPDIKFSQATKTDPLPPHLRPTDAARLVTFLATTLPSRGGQDLTWQEVRNRTAVALTLGAGITPGEARSLGVSSFSVQ